MMCTFTIKNLVALLVMTSLANALYYFGSPALMNKKRAVFERTASFQPQLQCTQVENSIEIFVENYEEYIDICYSALSEITPLPAQLARVVYRLGNHVRCYRFFDKMDFIEGIGAPLREQIEQIYKEQKGSLKHPTVNKQNQQPSVSSHLNISYQSGENLSEQLKWSGLSRFAIHYCNQTAAQSNNSTLLSVQFEYKQKKLPGTEAKVHKKLEGKGFHQTTAITLSLPIEWDITADHQCIAEYSEVLPHTTYVDYNQLNKPRKGMYMTVIPEQIWGENLHFIDIEKPAYQSHQYWYQYSTKFKDWKQIPSPQPQKYSQYTFNIPTHFRYPTPNNLTDTAEIPLHPFSRFVLKCGEREFIINQDIEISRGTAKIPVGNSNDAKLVSTVTLLCEVACALLLIKQIKKPPL